MFANRRETGATTERDRSSRKGAAKMIKWLVSLAILPILVVAITWGQEGFVAAGRGATMMILPVGIVWLIVAGMVIVALLDRRWSHAGLFGLVFLVWSLVGNGAFSNWIIGRIEFPLTHSPHPALERRVGEMQPLDAVVTLGGSIGLKSDQFAEINGDGERIVSAAQAYHAKMARTIITTGSSTDGIGNPSEVGRDFLITLGIPKNSIFEITGENTQMEMQSLAAFLQRPPEKWSLLIKGPESPRIGLITSAFHMPRAMRLARAQNLDLLPLPCAFRGDHTDRPWKASDCVPTADAQVTVGLALKEMLAYALGR